MKVWGTASIWEGLPFHVANLRSIFGATPIRSPETIAADLLEQFRADSRRENPLAADPDPKILSALIERGRLEP